MDKITHEDLVRITEEELSRPEVQAELSNFYDDIYPDSDYLIEMKIEREIEEIINENR